MIITSFTVSASGTREIHAERLNKLHKKRQCLRFLTVFWPLSSVFCDPRSHNIKIGLFLDVIQLKILQKKKKTKKKKNN